MRDVLLGSVGMVLGALAGIGCTTNPVTGRPALVLTSAAGEREIGREEARKVEQSIGLTRDPALTAYVGAVGARLAAQLPGEPAPYSFAVAEMIEPNAFALPGGYVYVSRGLLVLANSEDELACVLGHEIAHVAARHAARQTALATPFALTTGLGALATGLVSPSLGRLVGGVGELASGLVLASYSREQEREADRYGLELAARAGWDPAGMSGFLRTLERDEALSRSAERGLGFFASHPSTPERLATTTALAQQVARAAGAPIAAGRGAFLARLDGLLVGPDPSEGVFAGTRFLQPELGFSLEFPPDWKHRSGRAFVLGAAPRGEALAVLETDGEGSDPVAALRTLGTQQQAALEGRAERLEINGLAAAHVLAATRDSGGRTYALDLTWIAHAGQIYRVTGLCPRARFDAHRGTLTDVARSFRALTAAERAGIEEARLRVVPARAGESLAGLLGRTDEVWTVERAAVANALEVDAPLRPGQLLKVPVRRHYAPAERGA